MASGSIQVGNDFLVVFPQVRDAQSGDFVLDAVCTFTLYATWNGQSGVPVPGAVDVPMPLDTNPNAAPGTYVGILSGTLGLTPSMNPVAIQVNSSNYAIQRRITAEVAW